MNAPVAKRVQAAERRDFSNVAYDEALARARAMVPVLRERAARAEDTCTHLDLDEGRHSPPPHLVLSSGQNRWHSPCSVVL